jgi:prolyl oligopeptidase
LQAASTGGPVLLRIEQHSGHGGSDLIKATIDRLADEYAFALSVMGATEAPRTAQLR